MLCQRYALKFHHLFFRDAFDRVVKVCQHLLLFIDAFSPVMKELSQAQIQVSQQAMWLSQRTRQVS